MQIERQLQRLIGTPGRLLGGPHGPILAPLLFASSLCLVLLGARMVYTGYDTYWFLAWNLFLAAVPLALALVIDAVARRGTWIVVPFLAFLWLLFLPNAPYVVTDFVHLDHEQPVPYWFDVLLFTAYAGTSLALGLVSIHLVQRVGRRRLGAAAVWALIVSALFASSLAIYLGRFDQWNSWDLLVRPLAVIGALTDAHLPRLGGVTVGFTLFLVTTYAIFEALLRARETRRERGTGRPDPPG